MKQIEQPPYLRINFVRPLDGDIGTKVSRFTSIHIHIVFLTDLYLIVSIEISRCTLLQFSPLSTVLCDELCTVRNRCPFSIRGVYDSACFDVSSSVGGGCDAARGCTTARSHNFYSAAAAASFNGTRMEYDTYIFTLPKSG